ncbi:MAG TPA: hypothetical protein VK203_16365 [Nostocaceae cyanobacterium]|nr:hypothetical protein [Nostocaceae cyanobacterium]
MSKQGNLDVELPRIRRRNDSWDGKTIQYLVSHSSKKSSGEMAMEALTSYWLIEALVGKVGKEEFIEACLSSIGQLEGKLAKIKFLMERVGEPFEVVANSSEIQPRQEMHQGEPSIVENTLSISTNMSRDDNEEQEEESSPDDDDLGLIDLKMTPELVIATQLLGFEETR